MVEVQQCVHLYIETIAELHPLLYKCTWTINVNEITAI